MSDVSLVPPPPASSSNAQPWWILPALGALVIVSFDGALAAMIHGGNETQVTTLITAAVTMQGAVIGYFFGSSASSARKDETLSTKVLTP